MSARRILFWCALVMLASLAALSVAGALLGAERATAFFTSPPLILFWAALFALLLASLLYFRRLMRSPALLAVHLGPVLILAGSFLNSRVGHWLGHRLLGIGKVAGGYLMLAEGQSGDRLFDSDLQRSKGTLPFRVRLALQRYRFFSLLVISP